MNVNVTVDAKYGNQYYPKGEAISSEAFKISQISHMMFKQTQDTGGINAILTIQLNCVETELVIFFKDIIYAKQA